MPVYRLADLAPTLPDADRHFIAPDAHVIGDVEIGDDVGIWFGTVLRGDQAKITVGAGTNLQEGVMVHADVGFPATIGKGCTIGHHAIVHGCTLGDNVLVGMGATVLNGSRIGNNCLIGANALVTEGKEFPDCSLIVGAPARALRTLDEKAVAGLKLSAQHYIANWKRFRAELVEI